MIGSLIISTAFVCSVVSMVLYFLAFRGKTSVVAWARRSYHTMVFLVFSASIFFLYIILTHQYQYHYVYSYSSDNLSLGYLISTFWAGQEGSFMLWLFLTSFTGVVVQYYTSKRESLEYSVMAVFGLSTTFLLAMVSPLLKNPFAYLWTEPLLLDLKHLNPEMVRLPFLQSFFFADPGTGQPYLRFNSEVYASLQSAGISIKEFIIHGKGLNPLLQNFWMQIHPPILFAGFSLATVPFSFAISALMRNDYKDWVRQSFPWLLAMSGILGLGIMLGGYWAYGVLGWGGYWAWDPVENSSLVPWLISVAAIHTFLVQRKTQNAESPIGRFARTNLILSLLTYILVVYSTFLTRSGILGDASVHSFDNPGSSVYLFLLIFIITYVVLSVAMVIKRWNKLGALSLPEGNLLSRELALFTASVAFICSATVVIVGTSAPIIKKTVEPAFYNEMHVPLAIIIGLLNGLSLVLSWKTTTTTNLYKDLKISLIVAAVLSILTVIIGDVANVMMILLIFSSYVTLIINGKIAYKVFKSNKKVLGAYVAHIGLALFLLGVVGSAAYSQEKDVNLVRGQAAHVFGYELTFTDLVLNKENKYEFVIDVKKPGGDGSQSMSDVLHFTRSVGEVRPVMFISEVNNGLMKEPDILTAFVKDLYISPLNYDDGSSQAQNGSQLSLTPDQETTVGGVKVKYQELIKPDVSAMSTGANFKMGVRLIVGEGKDSHPVDVMIQKEGNNFVAIPVEIPEAKVQISLSTIDHTSKSVALVVTPNDGSHAAMTQGQEVFSVAVSTKPFISLVWLGVFIMVSGFVISTIRRLKESAK